MTENAPGPDRRPLDIFDSTADGFEPHTLEETLQAALEVVRALERLDEALKGCATPLRLGTLRAQGRGARIRAEQWVSELSEARDIIEFDLGISDTFPRDELALLDPEEPEPWNREGGPGTLSPAGIVQLRALAAELPPGRLTSYRREIEKQSPVPHFVLNHRRKEAAAAARAAWRATFTDAEFEAMWAKGRRERLRSYREFKAAAGSAGSDLIQRVAVRVDGDPDLPGNE